VKRIFTVAALAALAACSPTWAGIEATIESDYLIPSEIDRLVVDVFEGGNVIGSQEKTFEGPPDGALTITVIASQAHQNKVSIVVTGTRGAFTQTPVATARANDVQFRMGKLEKVTITLRK
jgi:hypothetical protein